MAKIQPRCTGGGIFGISHTDTYDSGICRYGSRCKCNFFQDCLEGKKDRAKVTADNAVLLAIAASIAFAISGHRYKGFFNVQTNSETIRTLGYSSSIVTIFIRTYFWSYIWENLAVQERLSTTWLLRYRSNYKYNLDPILIFDFGSSEAWNNGCGNSNCYRPDNCNDIIFIFTMKYTKR